MFAGERLELIKHGALDNWIEVDLIKDRYQLQKFLTNLPIPINLVDEIIL
ncbi:MAG: hypothetical protein ABIJ33_03255 [Patescibacteria group bacterium]